MGDVSKNLANLIPAAERQGETAFFEIFESDIETTLERLLLAIPTGVLTVSNDRLKRRSVAVFFRGQCVGCSYHEHECEESWGWHESFSKLRSDLYD